MADENSNQPQALQSDYHALYTGENRLYDVPLTANEIGLAMGMALDALKIIDNATPMAADLRRLHTKLSHVVQRADGPEAITIAKLYAEAGVNADKFKG